VILNRDLRSNDLKSLPTLHTVDGKSE